MSQNQPIVMPAADAANFFTVKKLLMLGFILLIPLLAYVSGRFLSLPYLLTGGSILILEIKIFLPSPAASPSGFFQIVL